MATRSFVKTLSAVGAAFAALWSYSARWQSQRRLKEAAVPLAGYFHPSRYALDVFRRVGDKKDFEEQMRGLMAPMQDLKIMWDVGPGLGHGVKKRRRLRRHSSFAAAPVGLGIRGMPRYAVTHRGPSSRHPLSANKRVTRHPMMMILSATGHRAE